MTGRYSCSEDFDELIKSIQRRLLRQGVHAELEPNEELTTSSARESQRVLNCKVEYPKRATLTITFVVFRGRLRDVLVGWGKDDRRRTARSIRHDSDEPIYLDHWSEEKLLERICREVKKQLRAIRTNRTPLLVAV